MLWKLLNMQYTDGNIRKFDIQCSWLKDLSCALFRLQWKKQNLEHLIWFIQLLQWPKQWSPFFAYNHFKPRKNGWFYKFYNMVKWDLLLVCEEPCRPSYTQIWRSISSSTHTKLWWKSKLTQCNILTITPTFTVQDMSHKYL